MIPVVNAQPRLATYQSVSIVDAYYADLDSDGFEDDIKILVEFSFTILNPVRVDLNMWVELPSGLTYYFKVSVYRAPSDSTLNLDCFDMATESGWYTVSMVASIMGSGGGKYYIVDVLEFDPPGGTPGLPPGVVAYF
jgi:hypothetical protein